MKTLLRVLPLIAFIVILLVIRLVGCQSTDTGTNTTTTAASTAVSESAASTAASPTAPPPTLTPVVTTTTETSPPVTNNKSLDWFFVPPETLNKDLPSTIPTNVSEMISKYNVIWQAPPTAKKTVYLTMDMGYEFNGNTTKILDAAKTKGVPITFFIIGDYLERNPNLIKRMVAEGHLVGNHTYDHPNLVDMINKSGEPGFLADLGKLETEYKTLTGQEMSKIFRPSSGIYSEQILDSLNRHGYRTYFWSFAYVDWLTDDQPKPATAKAKILSQIHDGEVLLLHAVSNTNTDLLPELIDEIRARGYEFGRVDQIH